MIFVLGIALSYAASPDAFAQADGTAQADGAAPSTTDTAGAAAEPGDSKPGGATTWRPPPRAPVMPTVEEIEPRPRPSGFWTSTRPAKGGAYRYRLLAIGVGILLITLAFMIWLVRRKTREPGAPDRSRPGRA